MLCPFTVAALVSLISVEVSCNLLQQLEQDEQIKNQPQPRQPWEQTEYSNQPHQNSVKTLGRSLSSDEGPRPEPNSFSASLSRQTVDPPLPLPQPSTGGCTGNPDILNFPGSPSMVFNPGTHVNFVIGVPEGYKMDISDAPDRWKIITITAPEGSDAISIGPDLGLSLLSRNGSFFPAGLGTLPNLEFPFMRPVGSPTDVLMPVMSAAPQPSGPSNEYPGSQIPGTRRIDRPMGPSERYPDGQYSGVQRRPSGAPKYIIQASQPESYPSGRIPNEKIISSSSLVPWVDELGFQESGTEIYNEPRRPAVRFPDGSYGPAGPSGSKFDEPIPLTPEIGRSSDRYGQYPVYPNDASLRFPTQGQNQPEPTNQSPSSSGSSSPSWQTGRYPDVNLPHSHNIQQGSGTKEGRIPTLVHGSTEIYSDAQYPDGGLTHPIGPVYKTGHLIPGMRGFPQTSGPSQRYPDNFHQPQGSQTLVKEILLQPSGSNEVNPDGGYPPDDSGSHIHLLGPGYQPGQFIPGMKKFPKPSGLSQLYPENFHQPQGSQTLVTEIPLLPSESTELYLGSRYPSYDSGRLIQPLGPGHQPGHLIPGMKGFKQPSGPSQRHPDGQFPDSMSYSPSGQQASRPRYQSGPQIPGTETFPRPSEPQGEILGSTTMLFAPTASDQYSENMNIPTQTHGYKPGFQELGVGISPRPSGPLNQGSHLQFPEYVTHLLGTYLKPGNNEPSLSPSETGAPRPSGSPKGYPDKQRPDVQYQSDGYYQDGYYPDNMANRPRNMGPRFAQPGSRSPGEGRPLSLTEPLDRYPSDQDMTGFQSSHPSSPDYDSAVPGRLPTERKTEPHSPRTDSIIVDSSRGVERSGPSDVDSPSGMRPLIHGSPQNEGYTDYGSPSGTMPSHQTQPMQSIISTNQIPKNVRPGQDGSPGGRMTQPQSPSYTTGDGPHSPSSYGAPAGTRPNQQIPSVDMVTTGGSESPESRPHFDASPSGRNVNTQGSPIHLINREGSPQIGPGMYSGTITEPQMRTVTKSGPQSGQMRFSPSLSSSSMIITYPTRSTMDVVGGYGSQSMGPDDSMRVMQPQTVQTTAYQSTPTAITRTYYQTGQSSTSGGSPSMSMKYENSPSTGGYSSYSAPSSSYQTIYPGNVQSGSHITYPFIQYQQPLQTIESGYGGASRPSYSQSYVQQPMKAVRSLDVE